MRLIPDDAIAVATIWAEARGEPVEGMIAVGEVILERMRRKFMSNGTLVGTVFRPYQWSCWNTTDPNRIKALQIDDTTTSVTAAKEAWEKAKAGSRIAEGAVFYLNESIVHPLPSWAKASNRVATIGRHTFYRG